LRGIVLAVVVLVVTGAGIAVATTETVPGMRGLLVRLHLSGRDAKPPPTPAALTRNAMHSRNARSERASNLQVVRGRAAQQTARHRRHAVSWVLPVRKYHISATFGQNGDRWASFHHGLDFAAPAGTPVRAVGAGRIIAAGWSDSAYGNRIKVRHNTGTVTLYAHLSGFERTRGRVRPGEVIGYVGATGNATGPHLHLEVRPRGGDLSSSIDPGRWLERHGLDADEDATPVRSSSERTSLDRPTLERSSPERTSLDRSRSEGSAPDSSAS
jgi:murein DD-endopeptidase MepM/ murein hydrolase activator NlpD